MSFKMAAFGCLIAVISSLAPAPASAMVSSGGWVKQCSAGYADGDYQVNCWWEYWGDGGGGGGGGGGYIPPDRGGGGGGGSYVAPSDSYTVGSFHCGDCIMDDEIGDPANGTILNFIYTTVNLQVSTWQAPNGTLKNVVICNGDCFKYQFVAGGNWVRSL